MGSRGSYAKGVAKREEILQQGLAVIAEQGYHATSIRDIADAVGLSQAGLLHYFASKDELFEAILAKRDAMSLEHAAPEQDRALDALFQVIRHNQEVPGLVQLYVQQSAAATDENHPSRGYFVDRYQQLLAQLEANVRAEQAAGTITEALGSHEIASMIVALTDGLQEQWLLGIEADMEHVLRGFAQLIRHQASV